MNDRRKMKKKRTVRKAENDEPSAVVEYMDSANEWRHIKVANSYYVPPRGLDAPIAGRWPGVYLAAKSGVWVYVSHEGYPHQVDQELAAKFIVRNHGYEVTNPDYRFPKRLIEKVIGERLIE